jgi:hypothetical protein
MKQLKFNKWIVALVAMTLFSCSKDNEQEIMVNSAQENFVDLTVAKKNGADISFKNANNSKTNKNSSEGIVKKEIESIKEVKNEKNKAIFYVINYVEGGYIILSADNRMQPIIAFSDNGKFIVDESKYSEGLKSWIINAEKQIVAIQKSTVQQTDNQKLAWRLVKNTLVNQNLYAKPPADQCYEHTEIETKGPYINTTWDQTRGFNYMLPYINCEGYSTQVLAGCVPIAMAQIMKYYNYPTNYNWSLMDPAYATTVTANFIVDIHNAIRAVYPGQPMYSCDATGVSSSANMGLVLKTQFRYSSADWSSYNYQTVKDNIIGGKPVLLSGSGNYGGHMWVCDGYRTTKYYFRDCTGVSYLYFSMNWGWNGANNGFYAFDNFNPGVYTFNSNTKMIYNIKP